MKTIQPSDADNSRGHPTPTFLTVAEAARALQTTQKMVRHWLASGELEMAPHPTGRGRAITARSAQALRAKMQTSVHQLTRRATRPKTSAEAMGYAAKPGIHFTVLGPCQPLIEALADIHDFRMSRGRRYDLASILALACVAMLCGCRTHTDMALWARYYGSDMLYGLGFNKARIPCSLTLGLIFNGLNRAEFEATLTHWADSIAAYLPLQAEDTNSKLAPFTPVAELKLISDKIPGLLILAPLGRHLGLPQRRAVLSYRQNELTAINAIIGGLVLEGQVLAVKLPAKFLVRCPGL